MGRARVLDALGDGEYRVLLLRDIRRITAAIERLSAEVDKLTADLEAAEKREIDLQNAVRSARDQINLLIDEYADLNRDLAEALEAANEAHKGAKETTEEYAKNIVAEKQAMKETLESYDRQIEHLQALAETMPPGSSRDLIIAQIFDVRSAQEGYRDFQQMVLNDMQDQLKALKVAEKMADATRANYQRQWENREQGTNEITKAMKDLEPLVEQYHLAQWQRKELSTKLMAAKYNLQFYTSHKGEDPELFVWCVDLTEDLEVNQEVALAEIPGERKETPAVIRPGFTDRAVWTSADQHATKLNAVAATRATYFRASRIEELELTNLVAKMDLVIELGKKLEALVSERNPDPLKISLMRAQRDAAVASRDAAKLRWQDAIQNKANAYSAFFNADAELKDARDSEEQPRSTDSDCQPVLGNGPSGTFYNLALMPAWQKHRPTYRIGKITALYDPVVGQEKSQIQAAISQKNASRTAKRQAKKQAYAAIAGRMRDLYNIDLTPIQVKGVADDIRTLQKNMVAIQKDIDTLSDELWALNVQIKEDHCDVLLEAVVSSQQRIDINRTFSHSKIPVRYMECNGGAFKVDDRVVVEYVFQNPSRPAVIGFESHPKACLMNMFFLEARARPGDGPNYAPKSFGKQAYIPTEEEPEQPPSPYVPFGYLPKDDGEDFEFVTIKGSYDAQNTWKAKYRVTDGGLAFGNRRHFAYDGERYKGCVSWKGQSVMGAGWITKPAVYAGEYFGSRISDYMIQKEETFNCNGYKICWNGRVAVDWQQISEIQYADESMIVAACAVKKTVDEKDKWFIRFVIVSLDEPGPVPNPSGGPGLPFGWKTNRQYCRPENVAFRVFEAPADGNDMEEKLALIVQVGDTFHPDERLFIPNKNDYGSFETYFIDSTESNRPQMPLGQFSADGSMCTILAFGGIFYESSATPGFMFWTVGAVASCRIAVNEGGVSDEWTMHIGSISSSSDSSWSETTGGTVSGSSTSSGEIPIAVDYDGNTEVLLLRKWDISSSGNATASDQNVTQDDQTTKTFQIVSTNGLIDINWSDSSRILFDQQGNTFTQNDTDTRYILQEVDLVAGHWMGFSLRYTKDEQANGHGIATIDLFTTISIHRNGEIIYTATNDPTTLTAMAAVVRGDKSTDIEQTWAGLEDGYTSSWSVTRDYFAVDASSGHIDESHYGRGPTWLHARDQEGNTLTVLSHNEWAPKLSIPGEWYENGGFRPNTTQHRYWWSSGTFEDVVQWSAIAGLDATVFTLGYV